MKHLLLLFITLGSLSIVSAQGFKPGKIVLRSGDTLNCTFEAKFAWDDETYIRYSRPNTNVVYKLPPEDISAFGHNGADNWYVSREVAIKTDGERKKLNWLFLTSVFLGEVSLYYMDSGAGYHYYLENKAGEIVELIERPYYHYEQRYSELLKETFIACPEATERLDKLAFSEKAFVEVFVQYHQCVNASYRKVIESPQGWARPQIGLKMAFSTPFTTLPIGDRNRVGNEFGISLRTRLPKSRKPFSIQIDAVLHNT
ncbi:MAG: hypothetical protein AB8H47_04890 [Bacteroidia bacterium]